MAIILRNRFAGWTAAELKMEPSPTIARPECNASVRVIAYFVENVGGHTPFHPLRAVRSSTRSSRDRFFWRSYKTTLTVAARFMQPRVGM